MPCIVKSKKTDHKVRDPITGKFKKATPASAPKNNSRFKPRRRRVLNNVANRARAREGSLMGGVEQKICAHGSEPQEEHSATYWRSMFTTLETAYDDTTEKIKALQTKNSHLEATSARSQEAGRNEKRLREANVLLEGQISEAQTQLEEQRQEKLALEERIEGLLGVKEELLQVKIEKSDRIEGLEGIQEHKKEFKTEKEMLKDRLEALEPFESLEGSECFGDWNGMAESVASAWPDRHKSRYRRVKVLLVQWRTDDLGVKKEIAALADVLTRLYDFDVSKFLIPNDRPAITLSAEVQKFMDHKPDTLHIFYYAGHGSVDKNRTDSYWAPRVGSTLSIPSSTVQHLLEESPSDAILLYDSCFSADTAISKSKHQGITELITACGFQATAPGVGNSSFTHALTKVMEEIIMENDIKSIEFSVSELFARVVAEPRNARARTSQTTPVHVTLTCEDNQRRIMLRPMFSPRRARLVAPKLEQREVVTVSFALQSSPVAHSDKTAWQDWILRAPPTAVQLILCRRTTRPGYLYNS